MWCEFLKNIKVILKFFPLKFKQKSRNWKILENPRFNIFKKNPGKTYKL